MFKRARSIGFKTTSTMIVLIVSVLLVASVGLNGIGNLTGAVSQTAAASKVLIGANSAEGAMIQYLLTKDPAKTDEAAKALEMAKATLETLTLAPAEKQDLSDGIATMEQSIRNLSTSQIAVQTAGTTLGDATAALLAAADKAEKAAGDTASQAETNSNNSFITLNQIRELIQNLVNFNNSVNEIQLLLVGSSTSAYGAPVDAIAAPLAQAKAAMAAIVAQGGTPDIQPFASALADGFAKVEAEIARHPGGTFGPPVNLAVFQNLVGASRKLTEALRTAGDAELTAKTEKDKERSKARIIAGSARNFSNTLKDTLVKVERYRALPTEDGAALVAAGLKKAQSFGKMLSKAAAIDLTPGLETLNTSFKDLQTNLATFDSEAKQVVIASSNVTNHIVKTAGEIAAAADHQGLQSSGLMWGAGLFSLLLALGIATFMIRSVARPMLRVADAMTALASGKAEPQAKLTETNNEIGDMVRALRVFQANDQARITAENSAARERDMAEHQRAAEQARAENEAAQLRQATDVLGSALKKLAQGDLTCRIEARLSADYEPIKLDFNQAVEQLSDAIRSVTHAISNIDNGTGEIAGGSDALARRTEQQAAALEQTAAALDEITANVGNSTKRTEEARLLSDKANKSALASTGVVTSAEDAMQRIEKSSQQISNIIGVIDEIAFQTNLLALNAGVEAARAGEAGKGFAVVAQEVRELAQRSAKAAKEIKTLISTSAAEVETGVQLVRGTGDALKGIGSDIVQINHHITAIATAAREQSVGLAEINTAINQMDQSTQQNAAMVEESSAASSTLASEASRLRQLIAQFIIDEEGYDTRDQAYQRHAA